MERHLGIRNQLRHPVHVRAYPLRRRMGLWQYLSCSLAVHVLLSTGDQGQFLSFSMVMNIC